MQMDRMGANFFRTVDMIVSNLAAKPLVLTLPIGAEDNFEVGRSPPSLLSHLPADDWSLVGRMCACVLRTWVVVACDRICHSF